MLSGLLLVSFALLLAFGWELWWIPLAAILGKLIYWWVIFDQFHRGDANPGVVVALNPTLLAVPTNLTTDPTSGGERFPVIKILEINLGSSCGQPISVGSRLATLSLYDSREVDGHWRDFMSYPANYATGNPRHIGRLLESFPPEQYRFLEEGMQLISQPYEPGLYLFWPEPGKRLGRPVP